VVSNGEAYLLSPRLPLHCFPRVKLNFGEFKYPKFQF